ncbi:MAG TPA: hypothetical protein VE223_02935 [Nitrososphaeraceae archaeon]|nr:hypothetical protein [Nitrososphaeraceae archaeon]
MNHTFTAFLSLFIIVLVIWSNNNGHIYAQQLPPSSASPLPSGAATETLSPQHMTKVKITSPTKGQQVPVGKDLTISGTSMDNSTSNNNCKVSVIVNNVKPYQSATAAGTGGAADYSKWNFVLTPKYTTLKPGQNKITARYECSNNPASKSFSSVNVTGLQGTGTTTTVIPQIMTSSPPVAPLAKLPNSTGNGVTTTANVPIVLKPLPGGTCPQDYRLVSGTVCIKDLPSAVPIKTTPTAATTNATIQPPRLQSSSSTTSQPSATSSNDKSTNDNSDNQENFKTKILKSFNKKFK